MAYIQAQLIQKDPPSADGRVHIVVELTGDAGEQPRRLETYVDAETTLASLRAWAWNEGVRNVQRKTVADLLTVGQTFVLVAPSAPPAPTAEDVWREKAQRLARLRGLGTIAAGTLLTAINALADDVRTSYQAGWIGEF